MFLVPRRQIWTSQPPGLATVDGSLPTPAFVFVGSAGVCDLVGWRVGSVGASTSHGASAAGLALLTLARSGAGGLNYGTTQPATGDSWTILVFANPPATARQTMYSQRRPDGGSVSNPGMTLGANYDSNFGLRNGGFACAMQTNRLTPNIVGVRSDSTSLIDGRFHVFCASRAGAGVYPELYFDGDRIAQTTYTNELLRTTVNTSQQTAIGNIPQNIGTDYSSTMVTALVAVWNTKLTDAVIKRIGNNPWQIFKRPDARIFVPVSAGNSTTGQGDISSLSLSSFTAGATPSVLPQGSPNEVTISALEGSVITSVTTQGLLSAVSTTAPDASGVILVSVQCTLPTLSVTSPDVSVITSVDVQCSVSSVSTTSPTATAITGVNVEGALSSATTQTPAVSAVVYVLTNCSLTTTITLPPAVTAQADGSVVVSAALTVVTTSAAETSVVVKVFVEGALSSASTQAPSASAVVSAITTCSAPEVSTAAPSATAAASTLASLGLVEIAINACQGTAVIFDVVIAAGSLPEVTTSEVQSSAAASCAPQGSLCTISITACNAIGGDLSGVFIDIVLITSTITTEQNILSDICTELTLSSAIS